MTFKKVFALSEQDRPDVAAGGVNGRRRVRRSSAPNAPPIRVLIAREIVRAKIGADVKGLGPRMTSRDFSTIARCEAKLVSAHTVAEIIVIEAKAASVYWRSHRDLGLMERKGGKPPPQPPAPARPKNRLAPSLLASNPKPAARI